MLQKRALRRYHKERMKAKARRIASVFWGYGFDTFLREDLIRGVEQLADNIKACSCYMCRNQRHNYWLPLSERKTRQELLAELKEKEELELLDETEGHNV